jgi:hypothetical protein
MPLTRRYSEIVMAPNRMEIAPRWCRHWNNWKSNSVEISRKWKRKMRIYDQIWFTGGAESPFAWINFFPKQASAFLDFDT